MTLMNLVALVGQVRVPHPAKAGWEELPLLEYGVGIGPGVNKYRRVAHGAASHKEHPEGGQGGV